MRIVLIPLILLMGCTTSFPDPVCSAKADEVADKTPPRDGVEFLLDRYGRKEDAYRECMK